MIYIINQFLNGITNGLTYSLLGLALVLIFRTTAIVNFAQGEMATFSALVAWQCINLNWPFWVAILVSLIASAIVSMAIFFIFIRPALHFSEFSIVILTIGIFLIINSIDGALWGYVPKSLPSIYPVKTWEFSGIRVSSVLVGNAIIVGGGVTFLYLLLQKTRLGFALRAAATNQASSTLCGIPVIKMTMIGWAISGAVGALAGIATAPILSLDPNMMFTVIVYSFAAVVTGGLSSYLGVLLGGLFVGVAQSLATALISDSGGDLQVIIPFVIILLVLTIRPQGIFGKTIINRV